MKKIIAFFLFAICYLLFTITPVFAQYGQPSPSYSIIIDKMVGKPGTSNDANAYEYVDNLSVSDPRFKPDQVVFFKIKIKNTSTTKIVGMEVRDTVPLYLDPLEGPGTYNSNTREIVWNAGDFEVDQEKVFYIKMKVLPQASLPADKGLFCLTNFVKANSSNAYDEDTAQLCIEKQVIPGKTVPSAGPEFGLLLITGNLLGIAFGIKLKRTTNI